MLADAIASDERWEVSAPPDLGLVAFRCTLGESPEEQDRINHEILDAVNRSGQAFLTHTVLDGRVVLRLAIGNVKTTERHVMATWELLRTTAEGLD